MFGVQHLEALDAQVLETRAVAALQNDRDAPVQPPQAIHPDRQRRQGASRVARAPRQGLGLPVAAITDDGARDIARVGQGDDRALEVVDARIRVEHRHQELLAGDDGAALGPLGHPDRVGGNARVAGGLDDPADDVRRALLGRIGRDAANLEQGDPIDGHRRQVDGIRHLMAGGVLGARGRSAGSDAIGGQGGKGKDAEEPKQGGGSVFALSAFR
jgi:hypothetical protein